MASGVATDPQLDPELDRPLRLGELVAVAARIYGTRPLEFVGIGLLQAGALAATLWLPLAAAMVVAALAFGLAFATVVRLVVEDPLLTALRRSLELFPVVVALGLAVGIPFSLASSYVIFIILAVAWLGLWAFAIPAAMLETPERLSVSGRIAHAAKRSLQLARAEYLHACGATAILIVITLLVGIVLAVLLSGFADNSQQAAVAISQVVLSPFFFIGLTVLYFEQRARAALVARLAGGVS